MLFPRELFPTEQQEHGACFQILLRNLNRANWCELIPEAQHQMLNEVEMYLQSSLLSAGQRQHLMGLLKALEGSIESEQWERLLQIFDRYAELLLCQQSSGHNQAYLKLNFADRLNLAEKTRVSTSKDSPEEKAAS